PSRWKKPRKRGAFLLLRSLPAKRRPRRPFPTQEQRVGKGLRERRSSGYLSGWVVKRLGAFVAAIGKATATARHPRPGTQSISALPRRVECDASDGWRAVETL